MEEIIHLEKVKEEKLEEWKNTYDHFSMFDELRNASQWLKDNGKTYKDYNRFYGNWLRRSAIKKQKFDNETEKHFFSKEETEWPELFKSLGIKETND